MVSDYKKGIDIEFKNNKNIISIYFNSKIELRKNDYFQNILKKYHHEHKENKISLKCNCTNEKVDMSCKKSPNDIFFLSNLPFNGFKHSLDCPFYNHLENLTDTEDKYRELIFKELDFIDFSKANENEKKEYNEKSSHRKNTYNSFCIDVISESMSKAFNKLNAKIEKRENLIYPDYNNFLNSFSYLISKNNLLAKGSIKESLEENSSFYYGVIKENILEQLNTYEKEYSIILPCVKKDFNEEGQFTNYNVKELV